MLPNSISNPVNSLQSLLELLTGSQLTDLVTSSDRSTIRLDWQLPSAINSPGPNSILWLVLIGHPEVFYLSYTQAIADRQPISDEKSIRSKNLVLQGARVSGSQTIIVYGHSPQQVEAGELHLIFKNFNLYDEQYGRIQAADLLQQLINFIRWYLAGISGSEISFLNTIFPKLKLF